SMGPDLSTVGKRFQRKEILESIVYPSHNVSDQYAGRVVVANGKAVTGLVTRRGQQGLTVLTTEGNKLELSLSEVDEITASELSIMPEGLLDVLTLEEVADLFAYLVQDETAAVARRPSASQSSADAKSVK
ncbi:MAG: hypothetical protein KDA61_01960, partial [Planctomycetales bacterium]|nr:hypothetical protein [Planctomycetales bacterium]